jgi:hypothetical protein
MKLAKRIGMVVGVAAIVLVSVVPTWAQPQRAPIQRPGAAVAASSVEAGGAGAGNGPIAGAGVIAFTGADMLVGLVILATLIVFGWAALAAGKRRERPSRRSRSSVLEVPALRSLSGGFRRGSSPAVGTISSP